MALNFNRCTHRIDFPPARCASRLRPARQNVCQIGVILILLLWRSATAACADGNPYAGTWNEDVVITTIPAVIDAKTAHETVTVLADGTMSYEGKTLTGAYLSSTGHLHDGNYDLDLTPQGDGNTLVGEQDIQAGEVPGYGNVTLHIKMTLTRIGGPPAPSPEPNPSAPAPQHPTPHLPPPTLPPPPRVATNPDSAPSPNGAPNEPGSPPGPGVPQPLGSMDDSILNSPDLQQELNDQTSEIANYSASLDNPDSADPTSGEPFPPDKDPVDGAARDVLETEPQDVAPESAPPGIQQDPPIPDEVDNLVQAGLPEPSDPNSTDSGAPPDNSDYASAYSQVTDEPDSEPDQADQEQQPSATAPDAARTQASPAPDAARTQASPAPDPGNPPDPELPVLVTPGGAPLPAQDNTPVGEPSPSVSSSTPAAGDASTAAPSTSGAGEDSGPSGAVSSQGGDAGPSISDQDSSAAIPLDSPFHDAFQAVKDWSSDEAASAADSLAAGKAWLQEKAPDWVAEKAVDKVIGGLQDAAVEEGSVPDLEIPLGQPAGFLTDAAYKATWIQSENAGPEALLDRNDAADLGYDVAREGFWKGLYTFNVNKIKSIGKAIHLAGFVQDSDAGADQ